MPFTLAHSAAALPLRHLRLVPSALIVGTLAPDFEYFLRLSPGHGFGHTPLGTFVFTLPLAIAVLWMFHSFVKLPAAALLPDRMQTRLGPHLNHFQFGGVGHFALIVGSTLVGIMTHLFWDSFTHRNTWAYHRWAALRGSIDVGIAGPMPLYKLLQHGSTILGTAILIIWILQWYGSTSPNTSGFRAKLTHNERLVAAIMVIIIASVAGVIRALVANRMLGGEVAFRGFVGYFVVTAISLVWWQFVVYGVFNSKAIRRPRI